jgi:hypothetical protein
MEVGSEIVVIIIINHFCLDRFREISGACWVGMVLPNPLTRYTTIGGVGRVEQVHYQGRLCVKRRYRWTWWVVSNVDGHLCQSYAPIWCCIGHIQHLVVPGVPHHSWALGAPLDSQRTC